MVHFTSGKVQTKGKDIIQNRRRGWQILFVVFGCCMVALVALRVLWSNLFVVSKQQSAVEPFIFANATQKRPNESSKAFISVDNVQKQLLNTVTEPYWSITANSSCSLHHMGELLNDDKFTSHEYMNMYCEVFRDFKMSPKKTRMLEIGFGCGHNNHGVSARIWKSYFTTGGSGVDLYEIDLDTPKHRNCSTQFLLEHPKIVSGLYLGDQGDKPFLRKVINETGGLYDIMLDDGGHGDWHQRPTFAVLWDHVMPGLYSTT